MRWRFVKALRALNKEGQLARHRKRIRFNPLLRYQLRKFMALSRARNNHRRYLLRP